MEFLCKNCQHEDVCRFKNSYEKTMNDLNVKIPTPFSIELKCPHYNVRYNSCWSSVTTLNGKALNSVTKDCVYASGDVCTDDSVETARINTI